MKRIGITVALLFCMGTVSLFAQAYKVVEKSDKKAPVWYESAESGYIVASAETGSMEEARQQCLESVKRQIIQAVAQNVEFSDSHTVKQTSGNGDRITEFVDQYMAEGSTRAASLPFIKGISLSKVDGSYWEKRRDKKSGKITYAYAIRYPFPESEHKALVRQFEEQDRAMEDLIKKMEEHISDISSVEEIDQCITKMRPAADTPRMGGRCRSELSEIANLYHCRRKVGRQGCLYSLFIYKRKEDNYGCYAETYF